MSAASYYRPTIAFDVNQWLWFVPETYRRWVLIGAAVLLILLVAKNAGARLHRLLHRRHPPTIHPSLQRYNVDHAELLRRQQEQAKSVIATSSGNRLAGFRIVRQVEAMFEDGYRTPEEAVTALKAAAAQRGANALLNVKTERTAAGKCSASGDAVLVAQLSARPPLHRPPPPAPSTDSEQPLDPKP